MSLNEREALSHAPDLLGLVREFIEATKKNSPGGRKITPEEWLAIGQEAGILAVEVVKDVVD
jgi:hypothetical protein